MGAAPADKAGGNLRARLSRATCVTPPGGAERRRYAPRPLAPVPPSGDPSLRRTIRTRAWGPHPHACHSPARRISYVATDGSTRRSAAAPTRRRSRKVGAAPRAARQPARAGQACGDLRGTDASLRRPPCISRPCVERRRYSPRPLAPVAPSGDPPLRRTTRTRAWGPHPHACHSPARRLSYIATDGSTRRSAAALIRRRRHVGRGGSPSRP